MELSENGSDLPLPASSDAFNAVNAAPFYPPKEVLRTQIKTQVEYYFSPHNIAKDAYMQSKMDSDGFIPLSVIAGFNKLQTMWTSVMSEFESDGLHTISDLIIDIFSSRQSNVCELSQDKGSLKPLHLKRPTRTTLILREVSEDVTEDEIKHVLRKFELKSVNQDVADTWFVKLAKEEDAKEALALLMSSTLGGREIKVRLKGESVYTDQPQYSPQMSEFSNANAFYPQSASMTAPNGAPVMPPVVYMNMPGMGYQFDKNNMYYPNYQAPMPFPNHLVTSGYPWNPVQPNLPVQYQGRSPEAFGPSISSINPSAVNSPPFRGRSPSGSNRPRGGRFQKNFSRRPNARPSFKGPRKPPPAREPPRPPPEFKVHDFPQLPGSGTAPAQTVPVKQSSWAAAVSKRPERVTTPPPVKELPKPSPPPVVKEKEAPVAVAKEERTPVAVESAASVAVEVADRAASDSSKMSFADIIKSKKTE